MRQKSQPQNPLRSAILWDPFEDFDKTALSGHQKGPDVKSCKKHWDRWLIFFKADFFLWLEKCCRFE